MNLDEVFPALAIGVAGMMANMKKVAKSSIANFCFVNTERETRSKCKSSGMLTVSTYDLSLSFIKKCRF